MILLDTCVISEVARVSPDPAVTAWFASVPDESLRLSVLTLGELRKGVELLEPGARRAQIERWLTGLVETFGERILPVDREAALQWGSISAASRRAGKLRPPIDCLLAATAIRYGLTLATRNTADFEGTGASVINPWRPRAG
jgi:toxin FitB